MLDVTKHDKRQFLPTKDKLRRIHMFVVLDREQGHAYLNYI